MRVFKNKSFERFARKQHISDDDLLDAIERAEKGLIDADLGGGVIKQRIARKGQGKSGGFRNIILFQSGDRAFFVYGFPKSERENIDDDEEAAFKKMANKLLAMSEKSLAKALAHGIFVEVLKND